MKEEYLIQACTGKRVDVFKGQTITVIDVSGGQVLISLRSPWTTRRSSYPLGLQWTAMSPFV